MWAMVAHNGSIKEITQCSFEKVKKQSGAPEAATILNSL